MKPLRKICLLVSGCGGMDGSDVVDVVLVATALARQNIKTTVAAPGGPQFHVVDHRTSLPDKGVREMAAEAARLGVGPIAAPADAGRDADAVIIPGGAGAMLTLCNLGQNGPSPTLHPEVGPWLASLNQQQVPIAAMGLSALLVVAALGEAPPEVTVGNDPGLASVVTAMRGVHHDCAADAVWVDDRRRVVTLPGRLLDADPVAVSRGIDRMIDALKHLCASVGRGAP